MLMQTHAVHGNCHSSLAILRLHLILHLICPTPLRFLPLSFIYMPAYDILAITLIYKLFPLIRHITSNLVFAAASALCLWRAGKLTVILWSNCEIVAMLTGINLEPDCKGDSSHSRECTPATSTGNMLPKWLKANETRSSHATVAD